MVHSWNSAPMLVASPRAAESVSVEEFFVPWYAQERSRPTAFLQSPAMCSLSSPSFLQNSSQPSAADARFTISATKMAQILESAPPDSERTYPFDLLLRI